MTSETIINPGRTPNLGEMLFANDRRILRIDQIELQQEALKDLSTFAMLKHSEYCVVEVLQKGTTKEHKYKSYLIHNSGCLVSLSTNTDPKRPTKEDMITIEIFAMPGVIPDFVGRVFNLSVPARAALVNREMALNSHSYHKEQIEFVWDMVYRCQPLNKHIYDAALIGMQDYLKEKGAFDTLGSFVTPSKP